ncbi:penicillin-binding transpeptidase domain-containing protein [Pseudarthrobacter siccitolerans]|uniref:penicillin-binding transpeptidase domain-containing protein n=1 Tax=Pseudarthrobacter siccitolerans TaxID=861266 RepID=UPI00358F3460
MDPQRQARRQGWRENVPDRCGRHYHPDSAFEGLAGDQRPIREADNRHRPAVRGPAGHRDAGRETQRRLGEHHRRRSRNGQGSCDGRDRLGRPQRPGATAVADRGARSVQAALEPGSTDKAVTAAAAIEEGIISPESHLVIPAGYT